MSKAASAPVPVLTPDEQITGCEAAALLLLLFGEEEAASVLSRLEPGEVQNLGEAMFAVANVSETDVNAVFDRFVQKAGSRTTIGYHADQKIHDIMSRALGPERAGNVLQRIAPAKSQASLEQLKWMEAEEISQMIAEEHPQIMALVLSHLEPEIAGQTLQNLPDDIQDDVVFRVATMGEVAADAIADIEHLLSRFRSKPAASGGRNSGGTSEAAAIMNNVGKSNERRIIKALSKRDKKIARTIEEEMFVFEDLIGFDDKNLGTLLRSVESDELILALKGAQPELADKMFGCMSSRAAQSIQDEMEDRGPVAKEEVIEAQKLVVAEARALLEDGAIQIGGQGDDFI